MKEQTKRTIKATINSIPRTKREAYNPDLIYFNKYRREAVSTQRNSLSDQPFSNPIIESKTGTVGLFKSEVITDMSTGKTPQLWDVCIDLYNTFFTIAGDYTALHFVPVLQKLNSINKSEMEQFMENPKTNHVLMENELLKVVLIHWKPGKISSIHGHPSGGCLFKVLHGALEELRYTADSFPKLLSVNTCHAGSMAYIDDSLAYHAVGNPFNSSAISLHTYTPGIR